MFSSKPHILSSRSLTVRFLSAVFLFPAFGYLTTSKSLLELLRLIGLPHGFAIMSVAPPSPSCNFRSPSVALRVSFVAFRRALLVPTILGPLRVPAPTRHSRPPIFPSACPAPSLFLLLFTHTQVFLRAL